MGLDNTQKRRPKGDVKFQLSLNDEQKIVKDLIINNTITIIKGNAGSGKTLVACQAALDAYFKREVDRIMIARPAVANEDLGFLPGDLDKKLDPYVQPIYENLYRLYDAVKIDKMIEEKAICIAPIGFMRGKTYLNSFLIIDEAQNVTTSQMEMIVTRIGIGSKMVICGDVRQSDLKKNAPNGFTHLEDLVEKIDGMATATLLKNHRALIVADILKEW